MPTSSLWFLMTSLPDMAFVRSVPGPDEVPLLQLRPHDGTDNELCHQRSMSNGMYRCVKSVAIARSVLFRCGHGPEDSSRI